MSDREIAPLPDDLRAILARDADAPAPGKDRVRARLDATLFGGPGGGGPGGGGQGGPSPPSPLGKIAAAFVVGGIVGGGLVAALRPEPRVEVRERVVTKIVEVAASAPSVASVASAAPPPADAAVSPVISGSAVWSDTLAAEQAILEPGRTALGRGDGASALAAADKHAAKYPTGKLAEEREAIAVQALVRLGRRDEARARGARFFARYPGSVLAAAVEAALAPP